MNAIPRYRKGVPKKVVCPTSFCEFPVGRILFGSWNPNVPATAPGRYGLWERLRGLPPQRPIVNGELLTRKMCPKCKHDLPWSAGTQPNLVLGLVGAKSSGKTHYVASLVIEGLERNLPSRFQASLMGLTTDTARRRNEFYKQLFQRRVVIPLTVGTPPPLIYDLTINGALWRENVNRSVALSLYDTAGENLNDPATANTMVQYLRVASGLVFIVDPLQSPDIRNALPGAVVPAYDPAATPDAILNQVLGMLAQRNVLRPGEKLPVPVAVVLSKCDVLRDYGLIDKDCLWNRNEHHVRFFNTMIHDDMNGTIAQVMRRYHTQAVQIIKNRFRRYAFFGVSATGCCPDANGRYPKIAPWRLEDPLLWLLAELGVIPAKEM
jgi:GTPase SAR1 family protein